MRSRVLHGSNYDTRRSGGHKTETAYMKPGGGIERYAGHA